MPSIFVSGASAGIGRALAWEYAAAGTNLGLVARRRELLEEVAAECRQRGAAVWTAAVDVRDTAALAAAAVDFLAWSGGIDVVIANAGGGMADGAELVNPVALRSLLDLNVVSVANTFAPFLPVMRAAQRGQLAAVASVAGYRGLPVSTSYSASKAALIVWMEGVRASLPAASGVMMTTICPGYVRTAMTADNRSAKWMLEPAEAARRIRRGIERGRTQMVFPWAMALVVRMAKVMPNGLYDRLTRRFMRERMRYTGVG